MIEKVGAGLPFSCEQMFDITADIERYPEFLAGWISVKILRRDADVCYVTQVVGTGPLHLEFETQARMHRPHRIEVTSGDGPFRRYALTWTVAPVDPVGCRIGVTADVELRSALLQRLVNRWLPTTLGSTIAAFGSRAHALHDSPAQNPSAVRHDS